VVRPSKSYLLNAAPMPASEEKDRFRMGMLVITIWYQLMYHER
jgi:hypothetical protein